jgi:hypothetical protein
MYCMNIRAPNILACKSRLGMKYSLILLFQRTYYSVNVPPPIVMTQKWFLKSLVPQLSKDVATSGVFSEEDAIMRDQ